MHKHPLGDTSPEQFLRSYWQQQPLLIRGAFPDYVSPLSADELAGLATDDDVESRIVCEQGSHGPWEVRHGPFSDADFASLPDTNWSLLVQAVDLWVPDARSLLERFDFLPAWRRDDLMVSFAPPGGSVGPHFDQYDVFLLQVEGQRRWRLGESCGPSTPLLAGTELQIIEDFKAQEEWLLNPGDMLYVPPGISHWGVAETACLTFSIGFRSPRLTDMLGDLALELGAREGAAVSAEAHYRDPPLTPAMAGEEIDPQVLEHLRGQLLALLDDQSAIADWFARYMTAPKYPDLLEVTNEQRRAQVQLEVDGQPRRVRYHNGWAGADE